MDKSSLIDAALAKLGDDMDDMEGSSAMSHGLDECPDPANCKMHDDELGESLGKPDVLSIEIHGKPAELAPGDMPSLDDKGEKGEGLSPEDAEVLRKLLR